MVLRIVIYLKSKMMLKAQEIRATYDKTSITVYQAYSRDIAIPAVQHQKFVAPFSFTRMTWIKPSFLWLMERSNWATKSNQDAILAIKLKRECWEKALSLGVVTHPDVAIYKNGLQWQTAFDKALIHIQWDPERGIRGTKLPIQTIQVGITRHLIDEYNQTWIQSITNVTPLVQKIHQLLILGKHKEATRLVPIEKPYEVLEEIAAKIGVR